MGNNRKELFTTWSKKLTMTDSDLEKIFSEKLEIMKKSNPDLKPEELEEWALSTMWGEFKAQFRSTAIVWKGIIFGGSSADDQFSYHRRMQKKALADLGHDKAVEQEVIDKEGNLLFAEKAGFRVVGSKIPKEADSMQRKVLLLAKPEKGTGEFKFGTLYMTHKLDQPIPAMGAAIFRANGDPNKFPLQLSSGTVTEFQTVNGAPEVNFRDMSKKYLEKNICKLSDLFKADGKMFNPVEDNGSQIKRVFVTRGLVANITIGRDDQRSNIIEINELGGYDDSSANNVTCWVAKDIPITFGVGTLVYLIGDGYQKERQMEDGTSQRNRFINAVGVWPDPRMTVRPENPPKPIPPSQSNETKEEKPVEPKKEESKPQEAW